MPTAFRTLFKSSDTRAVLKTKRLKATLQTRREVYRAVERRDKMRCRACGATLVRAAGLCLDSLEHHHIHAAGDRRIEATHAICLLCRNCHEQRHVTRVLSITGNADGQLRFEREGLVWHG